MKTIHVIQYNHEYYSNYNNIIITMVICSYSSSFRLQISFHSLSFDVPLSYINLIDKMWEKLLKEMVKKNAQQKESISTLHVSNDATMRVLLESSFSLVYNYETYTVCCLWMVKNGFDW